MFDSEVLNNRGGIEMKPLYAACATALTLVTAAAWAQVSGPTDPQIAAIVVTANQVDIDAGKYAESKSKNKEVKAFARQMVTDHSGVNKSATALVTRLNVTPEDNATSASLKSGGDVNLQHLKTLKGSAF